MGALLVVTGPPGSGKSTLSALLASRFDRSILMESDAFFGFLAEGKIPPWLPESNEQNHVVTEAAGLTAGRFLAADYDDQLVEAVEARRADGALRIRR